MSYFDEVIQDVLDEDEPQQIKPKHSFKTERLENNVVEILNNNDNIIIINKNQLRFKKPEYIDIKKINVKRIIENDKLSHQDFEKEFKAINMNKILEQSTKQNTNAMKEYIKSMARGSNKTVKTEQTDKSDNIANDDINLYRLKIKNDDKKDDDSSQQLREIEAEKTRRKLIKQLTEKILKYQKKKKIEEWGKITYERTLSREEEKKRELDLQEQIELKKQLQKEKEKEIIKSQVVQAKLARNGLFVSKSFFNKVKKILGKKVGLKVLRNLMQNGVTNQKELESAVLRIQQLRERTVEKVKTPSFTERFKRQSESRRERILEEREKKREIEILEDAIKKENEIQRHKIERLQEIMARNELMGKDVEMIQKRIILEQSILNQQENDLKELVDKRISLSI